MGKLKGEEITLGEEEARRSEGGLLVTSGKQGTGCGRRAED